MFEYVLVIYMTMDTPEYVGHFKSCADANNYVKDNYKNAKYTTCLYQDFINLPKDLIKKEIEWK